MVLSPRNPMARVCSHSPLISPAPRVPGGRDAQDQTFYSDAVPAHDATRFAERQESQDSRRPLSEKTIVAFAISKHVPTSEAASARAAGSDRPGELELESCRTRTALHTYTGVEYSGPGLMKVTE